MATTYTLVADQTNKIDIDNVEVIVSTEKTFTENVHKTPTDLKNQIASLDTKLTVIAEEKAKLEAELVEVLKEASKYVIVEEEIIK